MVGWEGVGYRGTWWAGLGEQNLHPQEHHIHPVALLQWLGRPCLDAHVWKRPALSSLSADSNSLNANSSMCAWATTSSLASSSSLRAFFNFGEEVRGGRGGRGGGEGRER